MAILTSDIQASSKKDNLRRLINPILKTMSLKTIIPRMSQYFNARDFIELVSEFHDPCSFKDRHTESFLGTCVHEGQYELLKYLLTLTEINPNIQNKDGRSPLMLACIQKKKVAVEMLLNHEKTDPNLKTLIDESPLEMAITVGYIPNVQLLIGDLRININITFSDHQVFGYKHLLTHVIDLMFTDSESYLYSSWCNIIQLMLEHPGIQLVSTSNDIYILNEKGKNDLKFIRDPNLWEPLTKFINSSKRKLESLESKTGMVTSSRKTQISSLVKVPIIDDDENENDIINWDEPD